MKKLVFFIFIISFYSVTAKTIDTLKVRTMFYNAVNSVDKTNIFLNHLKQSTEKEEGIIIGYMGMGHLLLAKNGFNPYNQLKEFYTGRDLLEKAIKTDSKNIELRFLRLTVQLNAPFFLNYSSKIEEDKKIVLENYLKLNDIDLKIRITKFLIRRKFITE
jgi:hypothetical protein